MLTLFVERAAVNGVVGYVSFPFYLSPTFSVLLSLKDDPWSAACTPTLEDQWPMSSTFVSMVLQTLKTFMSKSQLSDSY